jgi:deoxyribodipyrimidine photo-lyase
LQVNLDKLNIPLHTVTVSKRKTIPSEVLSLLTSLGCNRLYANLEYEVDELRRDLQLCRLAKKEGKQINLVHNKCIVEPSVIQTKGGKAYAVSDAKISFRDRELTKCIRYIHPMRDNG